MSRIVIVIPEFLIHVAKSKSTYLKINNNAIYSGNMHRFTRAKIVKDLHNYLTPYLKPFKGLNINSPVHITYNIYTVLNHGSISLRGGVLRWKPVKKGYKPTWDLENLASLWVKVGNDTLTLENVIEVTM